MEGDHDTVELDLMKAWVSATVLVDIAELKALEVHQKVIMSCIPCQKHSLAIFASKIPPHGASRPCLCGRSMTQQPDLE
jgi:hypothetical protein